MEQTNYEKLRTRINELLPDRSKLQFGCEVDTPGMKNLTYLYKDTDPEDGTTYYFVRPGARFWVMTKEEYEQLRYVHVLGKPLTIEDVLRALDKAMPDTITSVDSNGGLREGLYTHGSLIDLTKPLSAPENEAACAAVLKLLSV